MSSKVISTRIDEASLEIIEKLIVEKGLDKAAFIKSLILGGLSNYRIQSAVEKYNRREVTLSKAAELAGISTSDIITLLPQEKAELNYTVNDLLADNNTMQE